MNILFITNSDMSFVRRVRDCIEANHSLKYIFLRKTSVFNFFDMVMHIQWSDIIWCEFASYPAFFGVLIGRLFKKKTIVHVHRFEINDQTLFKPLVNWTIRNADKIICPSKYIAKNILAITGVSAEILYNSSPQPRDMEYIISVGSLIERKGHDRLIIEFKRKYQYSNMELIIVGRGPEEKKLTELIKKHGLNGQVHIITEYISDLILDILYKNCHHFALLSEDEGMSVAIIEAGMYDKKLWISDIEPNMEYLSTPKEKFTIAYMHKSIDDMLIMLGKK